MNVALQVMSFDEPGLYSTLDAYADQYVPPKYDVEYHACVTPGWESAGVTFGMVDQAESHPVFEYVECPPGKLSARNHAHDLAVERGADVIVAVDADAPPVDDDTVAKLIEPLEEPGVVASNALPVASGGVIAFLVNVGASVEEFARPHMNGQGQAITASAWEHAGPFDEAVDQTNSRAVRKEEEFAFRRRLGRAGSVVQTHARVFNDTRRVECKVGLGDDQFCRRIGKTTFHPENRRGRL